MANKGSNFSAFSKKLKNGEEALNKGRKGRKGFIEVEAGSYAARFQSLEFGANDKGPYSKLTSVVVESEDQDDIGLKIAEFISFAEKSGVKNGKKWKITEEDNFANLCTALQSFGIDTSELELDELQEVAESLAEDQPACNATVIEKKGYMNVRWGKFIEDDELPSLEDVLEDEDEEEDGEEEDDDNDDTDEEESDEESDDDEDQEDDDDDEDRRSIAGSETVQLNIEETTVFGTIAKKEKDEDEEDAEETEGKNKDKSKLPPIPKFKHESSTSAADDVLKKFFNRR